MPYLAIFVFEAKKRQRSKRKAVKRKLIENSHAQSRTKRETKTSIAVAGLTERGRHAADC